MSTPLDALWAKAAAFEGMRTWAWGAWADGYVDSVNGRTPEDGTAPATYVVDEHGAAMTARLTRDLDLADTYYVSEAMNELVTAAAEDWAEDEPVFAEDWPTPYGWMYVPGGLTKIDIRGALVTTSAISWHVTGGRVVLTYWADKRHDNPAARLDPGWDNLPQFTPWHTLIQDLGRPLPRTVTMGTLLPPEVSRAIAWHMVGEPGDRSLSATIPEGWSPDQLRPHVAPDEVMAWLVSALRIMQTTIADVRRQGLPAKVRKDLGRRPHRFKNKAVTVIEFRKFRTDQAEPTARDWSHRWLRRGHWRKQWYGSELTGDRHQVRIWIHPTICGPEGKPLLIRQHVNALLR